MDLQSIPHVIKLRMQAQEWVQIVEKSKINECWMITSEGECGSKKSQREEDKDENDYPTPELEVQGDCL